jgi:hypothetical protein
MRESMLLILLFLIITGCSHRQVRSYPREDAPDRSTVIAQKIDMASLNVALLVKSVPDYVKEDPETVIPVIKDMNMLILTDDEILNKSREDIGTFYLIARHMRLNDKGEDFKVFADIVREYLSKRIDPLLRNKSNDDSPDVKKFLAELQYYKAHLLYQIEDVDEACKTALGLESYNHREPIKEPGISEKKSNKYMAPSLLMTDFSSICNHK